MFDLLEFVMEKIIVPIGIVLLFFLLVLIGWAIHDAVFSDKISLIKSEWSCTATETVRRPQLVGKVTMMTDQTICTRYERAL